MGDETAAASESSVDKPRSAYYRAYYAKRYAENAELCNLRSCVKYYRKKKAEGRPWLPRPYSRLALYCKEHGLDVAAVIEGTQSLGAASVAP